MKKLRILEHISLDGVIQAPGGRDEDNDGAFAHGGWTSPFRSTAGRAAVIEAHGSKFDLLLGRRTYDLWAAYWPTAARSPLADRLNAATKHVATHRQENLSWGPAQVLGPDLIAGVRALKSQVGPDLIVWGSSTLTPLLLGHGLVDEMMLFVYPVLLGRGKRLFSDPVDACQLALVSTTSTPAGVIINTYRPAGSLPA